MCVETQNMRSPEKKENPAAIPAGEIEFIELLREFLHERRTDAMFEGFGNAFNIFPNDDHLLELHLQRLIADRYGSYLDWATIGQALWHAIDEFRDTLNEEQLAEFDSQVRRL